VSLDVIRAAAESRGDAVLVTMVGTRGSVPRHAGSKMLVRRTGSGETAPVIVGSVIVGTVIVGTVGGGRGEAAAIETAVSCASEKTSRLITIEMQGAEASGPNMVCGGIGTLLVEPVTNPAIYREALQALEAGRRVVFAKDFSALKGGGTGAVIVGVHEESAPQGALPGDPQAAAQCMSTGMALLAEDRGRLYDPLCRRDK